MWQYNNELYHFGIKGMKWGVRKKSPGSADHEKVAAIRKKKTRDMSNQDLRDANNRLQLERQYKDLTKKKNYVNSATKSFIKTAGTITAVAAAAKVYKKYGDLIIDKIGDKIVKGIKF